MQNIEIRVVWGGYRSLKVIDNVTVRSNSYHFLFDFNRSYMRLSCTVFETYPVICRKSPILTHPTCIWRPLGVDPGRISRRSLAPEKQIPWAIVWCCMCDPVFCGFDTIPACARQTDRQTDGRTDGRTDTRRQHMPRLHSVAR